MSEIIDKAEQSLRALRDESLRPWQQIHQAMKALVGLQISDLDPLDKASLEKCLVKIDQIISNYDLGEFKDYQQLSDVDVVRIKEQMEAMCDHCLVSEKDRILAELSKRGKLLRQAVLEVRKHRELFIPLLLQSLTTAVEQTSRGVSADGADPFMSFCLLTEFQEPKLYPILLDLLRLPDDGPEKLLGDAIHELVAPALAMFTLDRTDPIVELIKDPKIHLYVRWSAASVFKFLVRDKIISRDSAVKILHEILLDMLNRSETPGLQPEPRELFSGIASELCDLAAIDSLPLIRTVFERNLVDEWVIDLPYIEKSIAMGEETVAETFADCRPTGLPDLLHTLRNWSCFREESQPRIASTKSSLPIHPPNPISVDRDDPQQNSARTPLVRSTFVRTDPKMGRNEPCHCGSGKKFKKCCRQ